jgi:uncharacterized protein YigA (DUF484 family)
MTDADRPLTAEEVSVLRACILSDPALVLDDGEVMEALIAAGDGGGRNVVDLRGALVSRLEARLDQLSRTHRSVIAAAYENLAGTAQVHRASLRLLDETTLPGFLKALLVETPQIVAVDAARLVLETDADPAPEAAGLPRPLALRVVALPQGGVPGYLALGDTPERDGVWLRPTPPEGELIWGDEAGAIRSEALVALDLGPRRALLAYGSEDAGRFSPEHGVDLVAFLGGVAARALRRLPPFR